MFQGARTGHSAGRRGGRRGGGQPERHLQAAWRPLRAAEPARAARGEMRPLTLWCGLAEDEGAGRMQQRHLIYGHRLAWLVAWCVGSVVRQ